MSGVLRPCAQLGPNIDGPVVGQWGGSPTLPVDMPHPPFPFVASIDCAALPPAATDLPLPPDGHLLLFADAEEAQEDENAGMVVYVPAGTAVAERAGDYQLPVQSLRVRVDLSCPNPGRDTPEHPRGNDLSNAWWNTATGTEPDQLQVGGYQQVFNHDFVAYNKQVLGGDDWVLLAMADGSYDPNSGESDRVNWAIRRGDLAVLKFDGVQIFTDGM